MLLVSPRKILLNSIFIIISSYHNLSLGNLYPKGHLAQMKFMLSGKSISHSETEISNTQHTTGDLSCLQTYHLKMTGKFVACWRRVSFRASTVGLELPHLLAVNCEAFEMWLVQDETCSTSEINIRVCNLSKEKTMSNFSLIILYWLRVEMILSWICYI